LPKYYLSEYKDWTSREKQASRYAKGRVLDIGSGGGRWSLFLQKKGHDVLALDNSPLAIRVCKLRGVRNAQVKSISEINRKMGKFDTILMIGNNFGLFGGPKRARQLLRLFHEITSPDARIIAESNDVYKKPIPQVHKEYHQLNRKRGRMPGQVRIRVRYLKLASPWFDYLMVSRPEMKQIVQGTGWKIKRFILSKKSPAYIAIMEKEQT
jgi:SAM-dependent methyltransferase